jgi:creatinine amidohydrolase
MGRTLFRIRTGVQDISELRWTCSPAELEEKGPVVVSTYLADLTWLEAQAALQQDTVVLLPIGAIEAHGPHLPLDTDVVIATEMAKRGADLLTEAGFEPIIAPPIVYGTSFVGTCFPGTTPVQAETITNSVTSIISHIAAWGPRRFCVVNAHLEPAHVGAIGEALNLIKVASRGERNKILAELRVSFPDKRLEPWASLLSEEFRAGMRHAGAYETSLMLAAAPGRVRTDVLPRLSPVLVDLPAKRRAGARTFAEAGGTNGYFGDPASATAVEGERLFGVLAQMILTDVLSLDDPAFRERASSS